MEPEGSVPNSQELSTCPYPGPDQPSAHHLIPPLQDLSYYYPTNYVLVFLAASFPLASPSITYTRSSSPPFVLHAPPISYIEERRNKFLRNICGLTITSYIPLKIVCNSSLLILSVQPNDDFLLNFVILIK
jgi:hypothetical protein